MDGFGMNANQAPVEFNFRLPRSNNRNNKRLITSDKLFIADCEAELADTVYGKASGCTKHTHMTHGQWNRHNAILKHSKFNLITEFAAAPAPARQWESLVSLIALLQNEI